jgi:hypothetical protein
MAAPEKPIVYIAELQPQGKRLKVPFTRDGTVEEFLDAVKKRAPYAVKGIDVDSLTSVREGDIEVIAVVAFFSLASPSFFLL